ncbi:rRNA pseudouridine synthase [bacterium]|nr:rRNA pseudouridine synthase [bacterium]
MERLQKYMAGLGIDSRRNCELLIAQGRVTVEGRVAVLGERVEPGVTHVCLDGEPLENYSREDLVYIMLYKPAGYVTTVQDEYDRATVLELVSDVLERIVPVGRLDLDTEGLLLLTNDGELTYRLTHPRFGVEKEYVAKVKNLPGPAELDQLRKGIRLEDGLTSPAKVDILPNGLVRLVIHEGRKHQVKRMLAAVGCPVLALRRTRFGSLSLRGLHRGEYRRLNDSEIRELKDMCSSAQRQRT